MSTDNVIRALIIRCCPGYIGLSRIDVGYSGGHSVIRALIMLDITGLSWVEQS
jgi:hypothetical protein